jgi:cyclopropane-fatty-acyl-phospholipid synthase
MSTRTAAPAPHRQTGPEDGAAATFLARLFPAPRDFDVRVGDRVVLHATGEPRFTLAVASAAALRRMFRAPVEASLAEAFVSGALSVEGDPVAAMPIVEACRAAARSPRRALALFRDWRALPRAEAPAAGGSDAAAPPRLSGRAHTPERDHAAVQHHYDLGNDFYALFLGRRMVYSCAYFPTGVESLERAQELKLEHVCRKLRLRPGQRLLDVGCGWGGLLIHAATHHGVHGVGITLSRRQHALATERIAAAGLADRLEVRLAHYHTLEGETFDRAASVGMLEHVGISRLPEYFARVHGVLRPGGLFLCHGISRRLGTQPNRWKSLLKDPLNRLLVGESPLTSVVFPDTELVALSELNLVAEAAGWEVRDVENLREHYSRTLREWIAGLDARREEAEALVGSGTVRAWRLYFAVSAHRMDLGLININQTLLAKPDDAGRIEVPWSRADLYS